MKTSKYFILFFTWSLQNPLGVTHTGHLRSVHHMGPVVTVLDCGSKAVTVTPQSSTPEMKHGSTSGLMLE